MQVVLVMFRSDGERRSFSVVRNMTVIGRREDCDLRIPVGDVSRKHCRLVRTDDGIRIEDLGSSNGTFVNGQRIQESELNAGDQVGVGPVQFIVQINGVPEDDQILPPTTMVDPEDSGVRMPAAPAFSSHADELEEVPLEEVALEEAPLEEVLEEAPAEEFAIEEVLASEPTIDVEPLPEVPAEKVETAPATRIGRRPAAPPAPLPPEVMFDDEPAEPTAQDQHLSKPPVSPDDSEIEQIRLEETVAEHEAETGNGGAIPHPKPVEGDWDFVVDEAEAEHGTDDFHIDLDSPHQQPHT